MYGFWKEFLALEITDTFLRNSTVLYQASIYGEEQRAD
jgi:hypothetical protein